MLVLGVGWAICHIWYDGNFLTLTSLPCLQHCLWIHPYHNFCIWLWPPISWFVMPPSTFDTSDQLSPVETLPLSTDYSLCEAEVIHSYTCKARSWAELAEELGPGSVSFAPLHSSLGDTLHFLIDTNYNCPEHKLCRPPPVPTPKLSVTIPLTCTTSVVGYISNKHPDCFVWQGGLFEQGSFVVLGRRWRWWGLVN